MSQQGEQLQERTMQFAVDICELIKLLPTWEPGPAIRHISWREFIKRAKLLSSPELPRLLQEALELRNIFGASGGTARDRQRTDFKR